MIFLTNPPVGDTMYDATNNMDRGWLDFFNKFSLIFKGRYFFEDGVDVDDRKIVIYKVLEGDTAIELPVEGEGFVTTYDVDTQQITQIYVNSKDITLPSYASKLIVQGILKR